MNTTTTSRNVPSSSSDNITTTNTTSSNHDAKETSEDHEHTNHNNDNNNKNNKKQKHASPSKATAAASTMPIWKWDFTQVSQFILDQSKPETDEVFRKSLNAALADVSRQLLDGNCPDHDPLSSLLSKDVFGLCPKATLEAALNLPAGALFVKLQLGGIVNGVSGVVGGVTESYVTNLADCKRMWKESKGVSQEEDVRRFKCLGGWYDYANRLKAAMNAKVGEDKINEMPMQIVDMMCGKDMDLAEVQNLRTRVHQTVIMGQGTSASAKLSELEDGGNDIVLAKPSSKAEQYHKCNQCGNNDQGDFVLDKKNGDVICGNCGMVVKESLMHEGSQFRNFEGEADRNHHGDLANPLYSDAHNMSTTLGASNDNQIGDTVAKKLATILKNAHTYTEMNISQFGAKERKTRIGYKDKQKRDAFMQMQHIGNALSLHDSIIQYAKSLFAGFRDDRELVQSYKGILAACLLESFDKFSKEGKQMLKVKMETKSKSSTGTRSNWRDNLHDNAASKFESSSKIAFVEKKSSKWRGVSTWNLEEVRSWLTTTSHKLASESTDGDEMEGRLVGFSLKLLEHLQNDLQKSDSKNKKMRVGAVSTPRVDMSNLQIKWQKLDSYNGAKTKTAGQLLILKSVKKLIQITSDEKSSTAIHKELRSLLALQTNRKRNATKAELAEQRLSQMKRKPWMQAKLNK